MSKKSLFTRVRRFLFGWLSDRAYDVDPRRHCTFPAIPYVREWLESRFGDLCKKHDYRYEVQSCKICSDAKLCWGMAKRGYWLIALPTFILLTTAGWIYWLGRD